MTTKHSKAVTYTSPESGLHQESVAFLRLFDNQYIKNGKERVTTRDGQLHQREGERAVQYPRITKSGFSWSRWKLVLEAILELNDIIWKDFYKEVDYLGYHRKKLWPADGAFLNLPNHRSIHQGFDKRGMGGEKKKDLSKSIYLLSALYDQFNYLTLDAQTGPTDGNEQDLLLKHLTKVEREDILLLDRG